MARGLIEVDDFTEAGWTLPPAARAERARWYAGRLEEGFILRFAAPPFPLPREDRALLLGVRQTSAAYHKNVSYRSADDRVRGVARGTDEHALRRVMRDYASRVQAFAAAFLLPYADGLGVDYASFRPIEEQGRALSMRARNDLLHVDAFPSRPTHGDRILRVFTNVNPAAPRGWVTGRPFDEIAPPLASAAGLEAVARRAGSGPARAARRLVRLGRALGAPLVDRAPYDRFMLRFHDFLKASAAVQRDERNRKWEFLPDATWLVFTDGVPHAALSGRFALEHTFIVARRVLCRPELAPVAVLEALCGRRLA